METNHGLIQRVNHQGSCHGISAAVECDCQQRCYSDDAGTLATLPHTHRDLYLRRIQPGGAAPGLNVKCAAVDFPKGVGLPEWGIRPEGAASGLQLEGRVCSMLTAMVGGDLDAGPHDPDHPMCPLCWYTVIVLRARVRVTLGLGVG